MSRIARVVSRRGWQLLLNATGTDVQCTVHLHYTGMGDGAFLDVDWNLLFFCIINQLSTRPTSYFTLKFFSKYSKAMRFLLSHRLPRAFIITLLDTVYSIPRTVQWSRCTRYRHTVWFIPSKEKYSVKVIRRIFYCFVITPFLNHKRHNDFDMIRYIKG